MQNLGYYNGHFGLIEEMTIPMLDRACYFGDGIYEATFCRNHRIFALQEHLDRLYRSASMLDIHIEQTPEQMADILKSMLDKVEGDELFLYWQVTRGTALRSHPFPKDCKSNLWIMIRPMALPDTYRPIRTITAEDKRYLYCNIKTLNLLPSVLTSQMAEAAGVTECILHRGERVTECSHSNVSILKDGTFITAPADEYILAGVARAHLIKACRQLNIPVAEKIYTMRELEDADEILVSSSSKLCMRVYELDGKAVGGKDPSLVKKLQDYVVDEFLKATEKLKDSTRDAL